MPKIGLSLFPARKLADKIVKVLAPACERIEIAGSIRRQKPVVGDIEIVCVPIMDVKTNLFNEVVSEEPLLLNRLLADLLSSKRILPPTKNGEKFKQFGVPAVEGLTVDLFITTPEKWGVIFAIRTGGADFSRKMVTKKQYGGYLPDSLVVSEGRVYRGGIALPTPEESDFFDILGEWVPPQDR